MDASPSKNLTVAVVGAGHLGRIHAKLLASRTDCKLLGVCDPVDASRQWVQENLGVPTFRDHLQIDEKIDAIVVATPTVYHHQVGVWALEKGIHTFIEKPIATSVQQAKELVRLAESRNAKLQVGHVERFNPVWEALQERIEPASVQYIESRREGVYTGRSTDIGIVLDLMIHDLDLILSLIDSPVSNIRASGRCVLGEHEDLAIADLEFQNGARAHLRASRISSATARVMEIQSKRQWYDLDFASNTLVCTRVHSEVENGQLRADALEATERAKVKDELFTRWLERTEITPSVGNAIQAEHSDFFESIRSGRVPRVTGSAAIRLRDHQSNHKQLVAHRASCGLGPSCS